MTASYDPVDLAWAAGFLEGEGCFGYYAGRRSRGGIRTASLVATASQNEREPLDRLVATFGVGLVRPKQNKHRTAWEWRVNGHAAAPIMEALLPQMSRRRQDRILESLHAHYAKQRELDAKASNPRCPRGHLWSDHAGQIQKGVNAGKRYCKACARDRSRGQRERALA